MFDHQEIILARIGEIALKGLNRGQFERRLIGNIKRRLQAFGRFAIEQRQSRIWIVPSGEIADFEPICCGDFGFRHCLGQPGRCFGAGQRDDFQVLKTKAVEFIEQHL